MNKSAASIFAIALAASAAPLALAPAAAAPAAKAPATLKGDADAILKAAYPANGPGAAAIITRNGKVVYTGARGFADVEGRRAIGPNTVFQLGSIAKQFTAAVILQLVDEGKVSLDDPLSKYFPDWPQPGAKATVRQLLNHTSGIRDYSKIPGWIQKNSDRQLGTAELMALTKSLGSRAEPGAQWEYNNGGYAILGAIVEKVTGKSWFEAIDERIAKPLGLTTLSYASAAKGRLARRYAMRGDSMQPVEPINMSIAGASGGLVASVADMAKWAEALHGGKVVKAAVYREMTSPAKLNNGSTRPYGFGLHLRKLMGHRALDHGGAGRGIDTASVYFPEDKLFVAVFANSDDLPSDASVVMRRLGALALGSPIPTFRAAEIDIKTVEPAFGVYKGERGPDMRFFARNGDYLLGRGDAELKLVPAGGDTFYSADDGLTWIKLVRDAAGKQQLDLYGMQDVEPQRFVRTGALTADAEVRVPLAVLESYAGEYQTETLAVSVRVENGSLVMQAKGQQPMPLRAVSATDFMLDGNKMRVVFHPVDGKVDSFTLHRGARELHGKRIAK
ncbi:MAG TPA: serine hydrolase domain-containing protein [Sphingomicrobium sp.]|jgi:CubicO group peptidase (beta-lactamase class C family)